MSILQTIQAAQIPPEVKLSALLVYSSLKPVLNTSFEDYLRLTVTALRYDIYAMHHAAQDLTLPLESQVGLLASYLDDATAGQVPPLSQFLADLVREVQQEREAADRRQQEQQLVQRVFEQPSPPAPAPQPVPPHQETGLKAGYVCRLCGQPVWHTPSGAICPTHGGGTDVPQELMKPPVHEPMAPPVDPRQAFQQSLPPATLQMAGPPAPAPVERPPWETPQGPPQANPAMAGAAPPDPARMPMAPAAPHVQAAAQKVDNAWDKALQGSSDIPVQSPAETPALPPLAERPPIVAAPEWAQPGARVQYQHGPNLLAASLITVGPKHVELQSDNGGMFRSVAYTYLRSVPLAPVVCDAHLFQTELAEALKVLQGGVAVAGSGPNEILQQFAWKMVYSDQGHPMHLAYDLCNPGGEQSIPYLSVRLERDGKTVSQAGQNYPEGVTYEQLTQDLNGFNLRFGDLAYRCQFTFEEPKKQAAPKAAAKKPTKKAAK